MTIFCGIDLGTTNSTISVIEMIKRSDNPMEKLKTISIEQYNERFELDRNQKLLPSYLYFDLDNQQVYTGYYAKEVYASGDRPMQTLTAIKTRMGGESMVEIPKVSDEFDTSLFNMQECASVFLRTIAESFTKRYGFEIENLVITVPAAFNTDERQATINAAKLAGLKDFQILDEPTATLLYFINGGEGDLSSHLDFGIHKNVLVFDIGGGTLDICIAGIREDEEGDTYIDIISRSPRKDFGGNDFDQYLGAFFLAQFEKVRKNISQRPIHQQNKIIARIVSQAEKYKIDMSDAIKEAMGDQRKMGKIKRYPDFELIDDMYVQGITLTKEIMDEIFLDLTNELSGQIFEPIKWCLAEAKLNKEDISMVVMTGGMSKYYAVEDAINLFFGEGIIIHQVDSDTSVSKGAAIHCYSHHEEKLKKIKISDRMADDIFIKIGDKFEKLIPREITCDNGIFIYEVPEDYMVNIPLFLYNGLNENDPTGFTAISGKYINLDYPIGKGSKIELRWEIDANKVINIELKNIDKQVQLRKTSEISILEVRENVINAIKVN